MDFDDVSYDDHADLFYDLAGRTVEHFRTYLSEDDTRKVLRCYQKEIAKFIHAQMEKHYWEQAEGYEVKITKGFTDLRPSAYSALADEPPLDFRRAPSDKTNISKYLFGGFQRCLYPVQKFDSDSERKLSIILDREATKWIKPARGQFQIYYKSRADYLEYQPDFVAEDSSAIYMLEPKARNMLDDKEVLAKRDAAVEWCKNATDQAKTYGGKPWRYVLIPHDVVSENMTLIGLADQYAVGDTL